MEKPMELNGKTVVVTGGTRGLGAGIVRALSCKGARVVVLARTANAGPKEQLPSGVIVAEGNVTDEQLARRILAEVRPDAVVLNAGAIPATTPIDVIDWAAFSRPWEIDVHGALTWLQACLAAPMRPGGRVLSVSSGAAINGSPLSGGYAGAKRMLWIMSNYAQLLATERGLDLNFQSVLPLQMVPGTGTGDAASTAYASRAGTDVAEFLARFGAPLTPQSFGDHVASILERSDPLVRAFGVKGDTGVSIIEETSA
jgi:NAD(P)-dependent dehydrogenase (short-subunit alcohol dehydrogenase family)